MSVGYQRMDRSAFDYRLWYLPELPVALRGPRIRPRSGRYLSFIGAAQTFGRFCDKPFARQVGAFFETDVLNLGISGAGPDRYTQSSKLLSCINNSAFVVVQIMSARSVDTTLLKTDAVNQGVVTFQFGPLEGQTMMADQAYQKLSSIYGQNALEDQIEMARESWVAAYRALLHAIKVPVLLLWISRRAPPESDRIEGSKVIGEFPHLVTRSMVDMLSSSVRGIVDATYLQERPQLLVNYQTGVVEEIFGKASFPDQPWMWCFNTYYPTPEAHDHAAGRLIAHIHHDQSLARLLPA